MLHLKNTIRLFSTVVITGSLLIPSMNVQAAGTSNKQLIKDVPDSESSLNKSDFTIKQTDDGKIINMPVGHVFSIELSENPFKGYVWSFRNLKNKTFLLSEYCTHSTLNQGEIRQPAKHVFQLQINKPGVTKLQFDLKQPWERPWENTKINTFSVLLNIK